MKTGRVVPVCRFLLLLLLLSGSIAGCGGNDSDESAPSLAFAGTDPTTTTRIRQLKGTVETGAVVEVTVDTTAKVSGLLVADGQWSCTIDALAPGENIVTILATDATGNQSVISLSLPYDALSIERWVTPIPGDTLSIGGLVDPDAAGSLAVTIDTGATATGPVFTGDDQWEVVLSGLLNGNNIVKVAITHPQADVAVVEKTLTLNVNANAPELTIDPVVSPSAIGSQVVSGTRGDNLALTVLAPTAGVGSLDLSDPASWSATLNELQPGKNTFTVSATANAVPATARDLIIYEPTP